MKTPNVTELMMLQMLVWHINRFWCIAKNLLQQAATLLIKSLRFNSFQITSSWGMFSRSPQMRSIPLRLCLHNNHRLNASASD